MLHLKQFHIKSLPPQYEVRKPCHQRQFVKKQLLSIVKTNIHTMLIGKTAHNFSC